MCLSFNAGSSQTKKKKLKSWSAYNLQHCRKQEQEVVQKLFVVRVQPIDTCPLGQFGFVFPARSLGEKKRNKRKKKTWKISNFSSFSCSHVISTLSDPSKLIIWTMVKVFKIVIAKTWLVVVDFWLIAKKKKFLREIWSLICMGARSWKLVDSSWKFVLHTTALIVHFKINKFFPVVKWANQ